MNLLSCFGVLNRNYMTFMSYVLEDMGISYSDSIILMNVGNMQPITQNVIVKQLKLDKGAVARSVKNLNKDGLLQIKTHGIDRRKKTLSLTAQGQNIHKYLTGVNSKHLDNVTQDLSEKDRRHLEVMMNKIRLRASKVMP